MKYTIGLLAMILLLSVSCRKQELREDYDELRATIAFADSTYRKCFNDRYDLDEGETDVDCGGICDDACELNYDCIESESYITNTSIDFNDIEVTYNEATDLVTIQYGDSYFGGEEWNMTVKLSTLNESRAYYTPGFSNFIYDYSIQIDLNNYDPSDDQVVYTQVNADEVIFTFCDLRFFSSTGYEGSLSVPKSMLP